MHTMHLAKPGAPENEEPGARIHHNSDWSGDAQITCVVAGKAQVITLPAWILVAFAASKMAEVREHAEEILALTTPVIDEG